MNKLSGNTLKIIALICMTLDHFGMIFFPSIILFKVVGRLSFPIFAYMIAEGWKYTSNRKRYFSLIWGMGIVYQLVYYIAFSSLYMGVFISYGLSLLLIVSIEHGLKKKKWDYLYPVLTFLCIIFISGIEYILPKLSFKIDYGLIGILIPCVVYFGKTKLDKLMFLVIGLCLLSFVNQGVQIVSLLSVALLSFYNEKRGNRNLKWLFYFYYPLHLVVLWGINMFLK